MRETIKFQLHNLLHVYFLLVNFSHSLLSLHDYLLHNLFVIEVLDIYFLLNVLKFDLVSDLFHDWQLTRELLTVCWVLIVINLASDMFVNIEDIACTLVTLAAKSFIHDDIFRNHRDIMVIKLPPDFQDAIEDIGVVMTIFCQAVMDHDRMQVVALLFLR